MVKKENPGRPNPISDDHLIEQYTEMINTLMLGNYDFKELEKRSKQLSQLGKALISLSEKMKRRQMEIERLNQITLQINSGILLEEILESVYNNFHDLVPYNRIGFSLIENNGNRVRAYWAKTDQEDVFLNKDYSADLHGSSLEKIIATCRPRILNNLEEYLREKPSSESTRYIVDEGMRSSLTCPLIANGTPVGFIFFSSIHPGIYSKEHVSIFQSIAGQLSLIVEKGRLVSELRDQKDKIEQQNQDLKRLGELKNTFLGIAAHDLRNPLANILMISDLLTSEGQPLTVEESLDLVVDIRKQADYMLNLLSDILDVTQIESGKLVLNPILVNTRELLETTVARHNQLAEPKKTRIVLEEVPTGRMFADPFRIRQVLDNLLSNAIKYSPPSSVIKVKAIRELQAWRIEIADQGPGITDSDRQRLFTDFAKLSARPTAGEKSTGLGLAIIKRVVDAHHGKIGVKSNIGKGSIFWFSMPDMTDN